MFGFLVGWGVFWALIWASMIALFWNNRLINSEANTITGASVIGLAVSLFYLIAVCVGKLVM